MSERLIFRSLLWLLMAGAAAWLLLSVFEKSVGIAGLLLGDPGFPARYAGLLILVVVLAGLVAMGAVVISMSATWRGAGLFRRETDGIRQDMEEIREFVGMGGEAS